MSIQAKFGALATEAVGQIADQLEKTDPLFEEGKAGRDVLHAAVAAITAAISGGNITGAVGGSLTTDELQALASPLINQAVSQLPQNDQDAARNALNDIVATVGGVLGGTAAGGGAQGALAGAGSGTNNEVYNRQLDASEKNAIANRANGDATEAQKLTQAACYEVQCWAQYPVGSAEYNANLVTPEMASGLTSELNWVTAQQTLGLFNPPTALEQTGDYLDSHEDAFLQSTLNLAPGRQMMIQAEAQASAGNTGMAAALGVGALVEGLLSGVTLGGSSSLEQLGSKFIGAVDSVLGDSAVATSSATEGTALFRGTTDGYPGSPGLQQIGITPTSTSPVVATVFATGSGTTYGNGVLQIALPSDLIGVEVSSLGNASTPSLAQIENEFAVLIAPTQFANLASTTITASQARAILSGMGINIPNTITLQGSALTEYLSTLPTMSQAQISTFLQKAAQIENGK
jgi:hypothetical protein